MAGTIELGDAGVLAPGRWRWLRALGWMVALVVAIGIATGAPRVSYQLLEHGRPTGVARIVLAAVSLALAYGLYWWAVRWGERRRASEIAPRGAIRDVLVGLAIGLGMFTLVFASLRLLGVYTLARGEWRDAPTDVMQALATGLIEELVARAVIFRLIMRVGGPWIALAVSALLFGGAHLGNPNANLIAALAIAVEAGLMLAAFYLLTGRIWMSVGVHAAWNFAQGSIFGASVSGVAEHGSLFTSAPVAGASPLVSGGAFGPEASASAMIVGLAIFVVVILAAKRRGALSPLPGPRVCVI